MSQDGPPGDMITQGAREVVTAISGGASAGIRGTVEDLWGGVVGDRVRQWRQRNLINCIEKTASFIREKGIDLKDARALPDGEMYLIFDGASKEENEELQAMRAALLANRATGADLDLSVKVAASILSQMTAADANALHVIVLLEKKISEFDAWVSACIRAGLRNDTPEQAADPRTRQDRMKEIHLSATDFLEASGLEDTSLRESAKANLYRFGLITGRKPSPPNPAKLPPIDLRGRDVSRQLGHVLRHYEQSQSQFAMWASGRLAADEQPLGDFDDPDRVAINWEITDFGRRFISAVSISAAEGGPKG